MTIFAIEGPDGCGKTTLAERLRHDVLSDLPVVWPSVTRLDPRLRSRSALVMRREAALFESLYDASRAYVMDRCFAVSEPVYAEAFQRDAPPDFAAWDSDVTVCYIDVPVTELARRLGIRPDDYVRSAGELERVVDAYGRFLGSTAATVVRFDGTLEPGVLAEVVGEYIRRRVLADPAPDLESMLAVQRQFNERLQREKFGRELCEMTFDERNAVMKDLVIHATRELFEFLDHTNWKMHAVGERTFDRPAALEEYVDAVKFVLNFFLYAPFTVGEFMRAFAAKSALVSARFDEAIRARR